MITSHSARASATTNATTLPIPPNSSRPLPSTKHKPLLPPSPNHTPVVYPALLSYLANAFRNQIQLAESVKDGPMHNDSFDGREAVDKIAYIVKTTDRNLALSLGRALGAQRFFHNVRRDDHILKDSPGELYWFGASERVRPLFSGKLLATNWKGGTEELPNGLFSL